MATKGIRSRTLMVGILLIASFLLVLPAATPAEDGGRDTVNKVVLSELFTRSTCGACQGADGAMDRLADDPNYFPDRISIIEWHVGDTYTNSYHNQRISYYGGIPTIPRAVFDGVVWKNGGTASANASVIDNMYKSGITSRPGTTNVKLTVSKALVDTTGTYNITAEAVDTVLNTSLHLRVVLVEDGNETIGDAKFRYTAKEIIDDVPISLQSSGDKVYLNNTFTNVYDKYKIALVVFVQDDSTREVLQSTSSLFPGNNPPRLVPQTLDFSMPEDTVDDHIDLDEVFTDPEGETITYKVKAVSDTPNVDCWMLGGNVLEFTPDPDWNGQETFIVTADDSYSKNQKTNKPIVVTVTPVNDAPRVASPMSDFSMSEGAVNSHINLSAVFEEIDGDPMTFSVTGDDQLDVDIDPAGPVTITAPHGVHTMTETLTFHASDGISEATDDVMVTVRHVNHAPEVVSPIEDLSMDEDTVDDHIDLDDVFFDFDGDTLFFEVIGNILIQVDIDETEHVVTFTPAENWFGYEDISITATDNIASPVQTDFTVTVASVNDPPEVVADLDEMEFDEDTKYETEVSLIEVFYDADLDPLAFDVLGATNIDVEIFEDGFITLTPEENWNGEEALTFTAFDGQATEGYNVTVKVFPVNDPVEIVGQSPESERITIDEGGSVTFSVETLDVDGDEITYTWFVNGLAQSVHEKAMTFGTDFTSAGQYTVLVIVSDGPSEREVEWDLKVEDINRLPVVEIVSPTADLSYKANKPITLQVNFSDEDQGDDLEIKWYIDNVEVPDSDKAELTVDLKAGTHKIKVMVSDGKDAVWDEVVIKVKKAGGNTPGFEVLLLLAAMLVVVLYPRRKRR